MCWLEGSSPPATGERGPLDSGDGGAHRAGPAGAALGEVDANLELAANWTRRAAGEGAELVVFPELALTGYLLRDLVPEVALRADDSRLAELARLTPGVTTAVGFVEETDAYRFANSVALLRDGALLGVHRKVYLPTYGLFDEGRFTRPGERIRSFDAGPALGRLGLAVCEDFWHPAVPMLLALDGAGVLVCVAAGPARAPGSAAGTAAMAAWAKLLATHATSNAVAVAFCNRVGNEEGLTFWGGSRLVAPDGETLAEAPPYQEALLIGDLDAGAAAAGRRRRPPADEDLALTLRELDRIIAARAGLPASRLSDEGDP